MFEEVLGPVFLNGRQLGDGSMLLTFSPEKEGGVVVTFLVGIGEQKKAVNVDDLMKQLDAIDPRLGTGTRMTFRTKDGGQATRILDRLVPFEGGVHRIDTPPIITVTAPELQGETAGALEAALKKNIRGGRKLVLDIFPFTESEAEDAAWAMITAAVDAIVRRKPTWGL